MPWMREGPYKGNRKLFFALIVYTIRGGIFSLLICFGYANKNIKASSANFHNWQTLVLALTYLQHLHRMPFPFT